MSGRVILLSTPDRCHLANKRFDDEDGVSRHHRRACGPFRSSSTTWTSKGVSYKIRTEIIRAVKQLCLDSSRQDGSTWEGRIHAHDRVWAGYTPRQRTSSRRRSLPTVPTRGVDRPLPFSCQ